MAMSRLGDIDIVSNLSAAVASSIPNEQWDEYLRRRFRVLIGGQDPGIISQEENTNDAVSIHPSENNPMEVDSPEEEPVISIADCKHNVTNQIVTRLVKAVPEQEGLPSDTSTAHSLVPSGAYFVPNYFAFTMILKVLFSTYNYRHVFPEMNHSVTDNMLDAYCFGNTFVYKNSLNGFPEIPVLEDFYSRTNENVVPSDSGIDVADDDYGGETNFHSLM